MGEREAGSGEGGVQPCRGELVRKKERSSRRTTFPGLPFPGLKEKKKKEKGGGTVRLMKREEEMFLPPRERPNQNKERRGSSWSGPCLRQETLKRDEKASSRPTSLPRVRL